MFELFTDLPEKTDASRARPIARYNLDTWMLYLLMISGILMFENKAQADNQPIQFTAHYDVSKGIIPIGTSVRSLKRNGNGHYVFESLTKPEGIAKWFISGKVMERSTWIYDNNQYIPQEYEYNNSGKDKRRNVKLVFNWEKQRVTNIINGDPWTMPLETGTLDKLLYQLVVMYDLSNNKNPLQYQVADGGKLKHYEIKIIGKEKLQTELGTFDTVKISRAGKKRNIIFWCAEVLNYIPIRIQQQKGDDSKFTADLVKLEGITIPESAKTTISNEYDF